MNISTFNLHRREWEPVLPYLDPILPCFMVGVLPTFWEVCSSKWLLWGSFCGFGFWVHEGMSSEVWLSSFHLFGTRYVRYLMVIWCMCSMSFLTSCRGILSFYINSRECLSMAPCTHVVMAIRGLTFHPTIFSV